ncbi:MAG: PAC2 family protein [Myxococcota bacterium]
MSGLTRDALRMTVRPELRDVQMLLAFEGWNDAGQAASSAVRFVDRSIRSAPLAELDCEEFFDFTVCRPTVRIGEGGARVIEWPHTRFRFGSIDDSREIVVGWGTEPHLRWQRYCDLVAELVQTLGVHRVVLLGAYLADVVYSRPVDVTGFATPPALLESLRVPSSDYEGPTGIVGALADRLRRDGVEVLSLWAGLPHYISASPNARGALALVQKLAEWLDLKVDVEPLRLEAARFEERISALVANDPELGEYVRQLKRREFAQ